MGNIYLLGADSDIWDNFNASELVCFKPNRTANLITRFLTNKLVTSYHYLVGRHFRVWYSKFAHGLGIDQANVGDLIQKPDTSDIHQNTVYYSQNGVLRLSMLLGTVLASLLPIGSIVVLYSLRDMTTRLAMIGVFTAMFSLGLGIFTSGRTVEIFSATAAYALY